MEITEEEKQNWDAECAKAMTELDKYYKDLAERNDNLIKELNIPEQDFEALVEYLDITGPMEVVDKPQGSDNDEVQGVFKSVWVDQWSVGMEGDSFEGFIYAKLDENKWLKIPYSC